MVFSDGIRIFPWVFAHTEKREIPVVVLGFEKVIHCRFGQQFKLYACLLHESLRVTPRDSICFLIVRNRDFGEKYHPTSSLIGYPNIAILYSEFLAS